MDGLLELVREYGPWIYLLLFVYCALKSGALPLFAGYAAQAGVLELMPVVAATFAGGYLGDEARFAIARRYGDAWSNKWPRVPRAINAAKLWSRDMAGLTFFENTNKQVKDGGVPPEKAAELTVFLLSKYSDGITGKFLSAPWDPWEEKSFQEKLKARRKIGGRRKTRKKRRKKGGGKCEDVYKKWEQKVEDRYDYRYLADSLIKNIGDKKWANKFYKKEEDSTEKDIQIRRAANAALSYLALTNCA